MIEHPREPIKHTCPDIDKYIKWIKLTIITERELDRMDEEQIKDSAISMSNQLYECIGYLEELRTSNHTLREWGVEEATNSDYWENKFTKLESLQTF